MRTLGALAYIDNGQELLLLHRNKKENDVHAGKWIGVGGKFEFGESPEQCVVREIKEETGLIVQEMQMVGILTFPSFTPNQDWFVFVFRVTQFSGAVQPCSEGTLAWVPYDAGRVGSAKPRALRLMPCACCGSCGIGWPSTRWGTAPSWVWP